MRNKWLTGWPDQESVSIHMQTDQTKDLEGCGSDGTDVLFGYLSGGTEEKYKNPVRIIGVPAKIQSGHLQIKSLSA